MAGGGLDRCRGGTQTGRVAHGRAAAAPVGGCAGGLFAWARVSAIRAPHPWRGLRGLCRRP
eukprot:11162129-Lingulodinium_polyedra.AAC.1